MFPKETSHISSTRFQGRIASQALCKIRVSPFVLTPLITGQPLRPHLAGWQHKTVRAVSSSKGFDKLSLNGI